MQCRFAAAAFAALIVVPVAVTDAAARSKEQVAANCRAKLKPAVQACVRSQVQAKGGPPKRHVEGCRQAQGPAFKICVSNAMAASAPSRPAVPEAEKEAPVDLSKLKLNRTAGFVAPPRTIADITAILDQEKPDPAKVAEWQKAADAALPANADWKGYRDRAEARTQLGRADDAIADLNKAIELVPNKNGQDAFLIRQALALQLRFAGDPKQALRVAQDMLASASQPGGQGRQFFTRKLLVQIYVSLGELDQAEAQVRQIEKLWRASHGWPKRVDPYRTSWGAQLESAKAVVAQARGRYAEAEEAYRRTQPLMRDAMRRSGEWSNAPTQITFENSIDMALAYEGRMKAKQGRLFEAEADIRRALLSRLKATGKYTPHSPIFIRSLAGVLSGQGRHEEAEKLLRTSLDIYGTLGVPQDSQVMVGALAQLASTLSFQRRWADANAVYDQIDVAIKNWDADHATPHRLRYGRILSLYYSGKTEAGLPIARELVERERNRVGEAHRDVAMARGILAVGLSRMRRDGEALAEFRRAVPALIATNQENPDDDDDGVAAQEQQVQFVVEGYLAQLARKPTAETAVESFRLAEAIRGQSVQKALASSSARAAAADPKLAALVRSEQDLEKQIGAELGLLNNVLALPPQERDDKTVAELRAHVGALRTKRTAIRRDIQRDFPDYASLIDPRPPSVADIRAALKPGEAFLSFYFGRQSSFVWAVPKEGAVAFAAIPGGQGEIDNKVKKLREALEPQASSISEIPPFDLALAHELYSTLLKPVEAGWRSARDLIVVTNGALGLLPLGVLPVEPASTPVDGDLVFSGYRKVAWLARSHAVTMVPSAAALRTLRNLPPSAPDRDMMVGFGDPYFNEQQAESAKENAVQLASAAAATRGVPLQRRNAPQTMGVDSAEIGLLPRLPDTADELKSIAVALQADPSKVLHLGTQANEKAVKTLDLSKYKIVVFATHGLVPGELNGLHQPALALTAPGVAGHDGDGLLTMEEILALKLDADWVVLSACNTGAGAGAGAEAASGLGRAFFYAGTRAILVTNWSVHSVSARELVTDLFARQARDGKLSRGEALRQAMMHLLDKGGFADERGKTLFAYAHPLFWAPYTIIGDGGAL
jgi:CHAT domain-containing protein